MTSKTIPSETAALTWVCSTVVHFFNICQNQTRFLDTGFDGSGDTSSFELSKSLSSTRSEMRKSRTRERRRHEHEQRKRIRQREREERERERKLVLQGKMEPSLSQLKDPLLKVHNNLLTVQKRAKSANR